MDEHGAGSGRRDDGGGGGAMGFRGKKRGGGESDGREWTEGDGSVVDLSGGRPRGVAAVAGAVSAAAAQGDRAEERRMAGGGAGRPRSGGGGGAGRPSRGETAAAAAAQGRARRILRASWRSEGGGLEGGAADGAWWFPTRNPSEGQARDGRNGSGRRWVIVDGGTERKNGTYKVFSLVF